MTTESGNKPTGDSIKQERLRDLLAIDARIVELVAERGRLMRKESAWRRSKGQGRIDPALEKALWAEWEASGQRLGVGPRILRQFFNTLNLFGDQSAQIKRREGEGYVLRPRREPAQVRTAAPRSLRATRLWAALAAMSGAELELPGVILNDPLVELVKGLNQMGAGLSWTDDALKSQPREKPLDFEDKLIHAGDDPFNLFLLLALALTGAGRVKFSGGAGLKMLDVTALNEALPALGARIVPLNPHGKGLPARLECGGEMRGRITLSPDLPPDFAAALALAAWGYPSGLEIDFSANPGAAVPLAEAANVLRACGVEASIDGASCRVAPAAPKLPESVAPGLDGALCAYLLALPAFAGGSVTLASAEDPGSVPALAALGRCGIRLEQGPEGLAAGAGNPPEGAIDLGADPALLPLAVALGLAAAQAMGRATEVRLPGDPEAEDDACQLLDRLGADYELGESALTVKPGTLSWDGTWTSPTPHHCLAAALIAFLKPGIALENPGQLTSLWPQFWNIYNTLPTGQMKPAPVKEKPDDQPKRRRIKV
jgi:5-enolpyruvylshikimate-3-phosphate synthase/chorismate mutase